jgi:hypothetical protein
MELQINRKLDKLVQTENTRVTECNQAVYKESMSVIRTEMNQLRNKSDSRYGLFTAKTYTKIQ